VTSNAFNVDIRYAGWKIIGARNVGGILIRMIRAQFIRRGTGEYFGNCWSFPRLLGYALLWRCMLDCFIYVRREMPG
jgi:hypothetical protein